MAADYDYVFCAVDAFIMLLLLALVPLALGLCPDTATCINRMREVAAGPKKFWFGEQRRSICHHRNANPVDCYGPAQLSHFHSLGSRLFRAKTYHSAYLRNLEIFPRITYRAINGTYRACEHDYSIHNASIPIEADPDMQPVQPFSTRYKPEIGWHDLQFDSEHILLVTDVGFGTLNYLVEDFPRKPKVLREYEPSDNFRPSPNPLALLVFRKGAANVSFSNPEDFNLVDFMMTNELEDNLIGMNVVVISSDPFAIERQRLKGNVDNCHSLIKNKFHRNLPSRFMQLLNPNDLTQWLSVSFERPHIDVNVCCQRVRKNKATVHLDPIGELSISAFSTLQSPTFTSMRSPIQNSNYMNYHRQARTYVALMDDLFTLCVIDGISGRLHWLLVDIPSNELAGAEEKGITKASYHPLLPRNPAECRPFLFILLEQSGSLKTIDGYCDGDCTGRKEFKLDDFKQKQGLKLSAINWVQSCYDLSYAYHVLANENQERNETTHVESRKHKRPPGQSRLASDLSLEVCSAFKVSSHHRCTVSQASRDHIHESMFVLLTSLVIYYV